MTDFRNLSKFIGSFPVDYNGWWYFAVPAKCVKKIGLPLPTFIHGDDVEYGVRCAKAGWNCITPLGIGVWHEGFQSRHRTWIVYYDIRNFLIMQTLMFENRNWSSKQITKSLRNRINCEIKKFEYGKVLIMIKGLEDFLKGSNILTEKNPLELHLEIVDLYNKNPFSYKISHNDLNQKIKNPIPVNKNSKPNHKMIKYLKRLLPNFILSKFKKHDYISSDLYLNEKFVPFNAKSLIIHNTWNEELICYNYNEALDKKLRKDVLGLLRDFNKNYEKKKISWQLSVADLQSVSFWTNYLNLKKLS